MSGRALWTSNSLRGGAIRSVRFGAIGLALGLALIIASSASALASGKTASISPASAFAFPSTKACVSGHTLTFRVRSIPHVTWRSVTVFVNGHHVITVMHPRRVRLRNLPSGSFVVKATAHAIDGRHVTAIKKYKTCAEPQSGSYSGSGYTLYVSSDSTKVQDVSLAAGYHAVLTCLPGGATLNDTSFYLPQISIGADGSFSGTASQTGVEGGAAATFTYKVSGRFTGTTAEGSLRETVTYDNGTSYSCTSGTTPWTMTRDAQGTQAAAAPPPGSYSGDGFTFYVSSGSTHLQDVSLAAGYHNVLACVPTKGFNDTSFYIPQIAINADGSFSGTASQTGVEDGAAATFTYTFSGHFHGTNANGTERAAGSLREDITYNDGTAYSCTIGLTPWTMTRDTQGSQTATAPPPGSYSGDGFTFYVSSDGTHAQDVSLAAGYHNVLACVPTLGLNDSSFYIPQISINADGSFSGTATQNAMANGSPATFTYTFSGHFHGTDSNGTERVAGSLREDISYDNGTAYSCTTGLTPWTMTRDTQGTQAAAPPPPGTYSGDGFTFHVSADSSQVQNVALAAGYHAALACAPGGANLNDTSFGIPAITINADGSFSGTATFTYTFSGHFHGTDSGGNERAAGSLREDVTYNNGTAYTCTTGTTPWTMKRTGP